MSVSLTEELELFTHQKPMRNLAEAIQTGLFQGATFDVFFQEKHLRINNVHMLVKGTRVYPDPLRLPSEILQLRKGAWKRARSQRLDLYLNMHAIPMAVHDKDKKLMFVTLKHTNTEGYTVQIVIYRPGREPAPGDVQIVDWPIGLNPIMNTGAANENI